ncbi:cytochrome P450 2F5-like isoform X2 [Symsagittifera roscoffensis]
MDERLSLELEHLHKKYGSMVSLAIAGNNIWDVWINDFDIVKEVLNDPRFNSRNVFGFFELFEVQNGLAFASGESWKAKRKVIHQIFRSMGVGRNSFGQKVEAEVEKFVKHLDKLEKKELDIRKYAGYLSNNVIFSLLFNKTFNYEDPKYLELYYYINQLFELQNPSGLHWVVPLWVAKHMSVSKKLLSLRKKFSDNLLSEFMARKPSSADAARNREPECLADHLWDKMLVDNDPIVTEKTVVGILVDIVLAGQETTTNSLSWLFLAMIHYPAVQEMVFNELSSKTDLSLPVVPYSVQNECDYTVATIWEAMRVYPVLYSTLDHTASEDIDNLHGFRIPKGTRLFGNMVCIFKDKKYWKVPESFNLENFLNEDGKYNKQPYMAPFGLGARACIGENVARMEVFTAFASIMRKFKIEAVGIEKPSLVPVVGFVGIAPSPFKVNLTNRTS